MIRRILLAATSLSLVSPALAQQAPIPPTIRDFQGNRTTATAIVCVQDPAATPVVLVACGTGTGSGGGGDASAANQTAVQANAGSDAAKATAVQGIAGGKAIPVSGTFWQPTQPISIASLPPLGAGSNTIGLIGNTAFGISGTLPAFGSTPTFNIGTAPTIAISAATLPLPSGAATAAKQDVEAGYLATIAAAAADTTTASPTNMTQVGGATVTLGPKTPALSLPTTNPKSATGTSANVSAATTSTLALAANAARNGCNIINDSTSVAYVKLGTSASSTSFDYYMAGSSSGVPASFACPSDWTGVVSMIWASATGTARVSERTN